MDIEERKIIYEEHDGKIIPRGDRNSYNINLSRILDEEVDEELGNMYD